MNASTENEPSGSLDMVKWGLVLLLLAGAVVGNYIFVEQSILVRAVGVVVLIALAGVIAMQTLKGRIFVDFAKESRTEIRKVVWPTKQEAWQTTLIVLVVTVIMAIILWGLDSLLFWLVGLVTGLKVG